MANVYNVAGSRFYIGGRITPKPNMVASDYASQVWQEVDMWQTAGALGDAAEITSTAVINQTRVIKTKGARDAGDSEQTFVLVDDDPGQIALLAAERSCDNYAFRVEFSKGCETSSVVTISVATPAVVTWAAHGLTAGAPVRFSPNGGTMPAGLSADTTYYVAATPAPAAGTFSVSATIGGAAVAVTAAGTATSITATAIPAGRTRLFAGLVTSYSEQGGDANAAQMLVSTIAINSNLVRI